MSTTKTAMLAENVNRYIRTNQIKMASPSQVQAAALRLANGHL
jgi:hypothetical protein